MFSSESTTLTTSLSHHPSSLNLSLITKSTRPPVSSCPVSLSDSSSPQSSTMADQVSEALEVPREFVKDGVQFSTQPILSRARWSHIIKLVDANMAYSLVTRCQKPDQKEFLKVRCLGKPNV